jgi:macrolide-specific efflux system membrane fusion protein
MRIGTGLIITVLSTFALMAYAAAPPGGSNELRPRVAAAPAKRDSETPRGEARESAPREGNKAAPRDARIWPCQITLIDDVEVPAPESGILVAMEVREEQSVTRGQLLAVVDGRQQEMQRDASVIERNAAAAKASDDIEVRYAEAAYEKAAAELDDSLAINKRNEGSITQTRLRELRLERERARLQIERAKLDLKVAGMTAAVHDAKVKLAEESISRRQIQAPIDGEVIAVNLQPDEWVSAGDSVFRIVRLDRVRIEGLVNAKEYDPSEIANREVTVEVELARGRTVQFPGRVTNVNPIVKSNLYRVRAEVENRREDDFWLLQPGREAAMVVHLRTSPRNAARPR